MSKLVLPTSDQPRVSILILTRHDPAMLRACLASIAGGGPGGHLAYEIVLVLNGADAGVVDFATRELDGVRVLRSDVNLGFGGGMNRAARHARGELLLLLNDDVEVEPGWLEPLVETLDAHPQAAAVGSRSLFTDGRVQEAGSVLFSDGSTAPVGRGLPAGTAKWSFVRKVDYCSANSLLVRRSAFDEIGGFDSRYFPAYYEDTDLSLALRAAGHSILYDGRSRIRHLESQSTTTHFKHFLFRRNVEKLREKWPAELAKQLPRPAGGGPDGPVPETMLPAIARARGDLSRVLVVDDMLPIRSLGAGFVLTHNLAAEAGLDHCALSVYATKHPGADPLSVAGLGYDVLDGDLETILRDPKQRFDAVVLCRPDNFEAVSAAVRKHQPQAAVIYVAEALFGVRFEREAELADADGPSRRGSALRKDAEKSWRIETRAVREADRVVAVSPEECSKLRGIDGAKPVDLVFPLQSDLALTADDPGARDGILYTSSWTAQDETTPNADGMRWFCADVLPNITGILPWTKLRATGSNPPASVRRLAGAHVELTGFVPDLRDVYERARVVVVPLRFGAGVKNKTVEALQYGVPVVTTTIGAEGIEIPDALAPLIVTDDPAEFATAVLTLLTDGHEWRARRRDIESLRQHWEANPGRSWVQVIDDAIREHGGRTMKHSSGDNEETG
ncbi:MAG: glycosyltransferase [Acidothermaceae bacterium]